MITNNIIATEYDNPRIINTNNSNAYDGTVRWSPVKSLWISSMTLAGIIGSFYYAAFSNFILFLISTSITLCLGHSLGMHRRFIHHSYNCPNWLEYIFVYFGVLVGLAGPFGMMATHDMRDWAQRQKRSHPYFGHKSKFVKDGFWQMHCDIQLAHPPQFRPENTVANNKFYLFLEKTWMLQQLPVALILFYFGGLAWVIWGVCLRVSVCVTGHWLIGYFAHNCGQRDWHVNNAAVQGYNIKFCGLITMGECWHNNHHAFPNSAKLGINSSQCDPGWWVLVLLQHIGLAWDIKTPEDLPIRPELVPIK